LNPKSEHRRGGCVATIRLGIFTRSVLLEVARVIGALAEAGVEVAEIPVSSSPAQFASLRDGEFDAILTSPDNVLAYNLLPDNPLGMLLDVEILAGLDRGSGLSLAVRPGLDDLADVTAHSLRGAGGVAQRLRLGVDVPNSGFAFVGYALLGRAGLARSDYEIVTLGSTPKRVRALLEGDCDVTVLGQGNELIAADQGARLMGSVTQCGPYLGSVLARLRGKAPEDANGDQRVDRLTQALLATSRGILDGALQGVAETCAASVLGMNASLAAGHVAVLRSGDQGLIPDGRMSRAAFATLIALRAAALPAPQLVDAADQLDAFVAPGMLVN
jgi:ABC-type nitrate/sulfonate/bicarbonate transport system substrate-binding protein